MTRLRAERALGLHVHPHMHGAWTTLARPFAFYGAWILKIDPVSWRVDLFRIPEWRREAMTARKHKDTPAGSVLDCRHKPWHRYSRFPCTCGRPLWPPRGQGRGEGPNSPRRVAARERAEQAFQLRLERRMRWADIARALGFAGKSGAHAAVLRYLIDDYRAAGEPHVLHAARVHLNDLILMRSNPALQRNPRRL